MAYKFDNWTYKVYDKTFLKDVHLCMTFPKVDNIDTKKEGLMSVFKTFFNLKELNVDNLFSVIHVKSEDESICYDFKLDSVELTMRRPAYKSCKLTEAMMKAVFSYMRELGVEHIEKFEFFKYNELEYTLPNGSIGMMEIMKGVFTEHLIKAIDDENISDNDAYMKKLTRWEKVISMADDESKSLFNIEYGFSRKSLDSIKGVLALKTRIETDQDGVVFEALAEKIASFNQILDDAFHWCVRQEVITMMEKTE